MEKVPHYKIVKEGDWIFTCSMEPKQFKSFHKPKKEENYERSAFSDEEWERFSKFDDFVCIDGSCHSSRHCSLRIISEKYAKWFIDNTIWKLFDDKLEPENAFNDYEKKVKKLVKEAGLEYEGI